MAAKDRDPQTSTAAGTGAGPHTKTGGHGGPGAARPRRRRRGGRGGGSGHGPPQHAFRGEFLDRLLERDPAADRGAGGGRRTLGGGGRPRLRMGRLPPGRGGAGRAAQGGEGEAFLGEPAGLFEDLQDALLLAAALPGSGHAGGLRLRPERGPDGYVLSDGGRDAGRLAWFDIHLVATLSAFRALVACPRCLALLLDAAGHDALDQAGRILARRAADDTME